MTDTHQEDLRSDLQKKEEAEAEAFAALPKAAKVAKLLDEVIDRLKHQVRHNAPISQGLINELEAIRALVG